MANQVILVDEAPINPIEIEGKFTQDDYLQFHCAGIDGWENIPDRVRIWMKVKNDNTEPKEYQLVTDESKTNVSLKFTEDSSDVVPNEDTITLNGNTHQIYFSPLNISFSSEYKYGDVVYKNPYTDKTEKWFKNFKTVNAMVQATSPSPWIAIQDDVINIAENDEGQTRSAKIDFVLMSEDGDMPLKSINIKQENLKDLMLGSFTVSLGSFTSTDLPSDFITPLKVNYSTFTVNDLFLCNIIEQGETRIDEKLGNDTDFVDINIDSSDTDNYTKLGVNPDDLVGGDYLCYFTFSNENEEKGEFHIDSVVSKRLDSNFSDTYANISYDSLNKELNVSLNYSTNEITPPKKIEGDSDTEWEEYNQTMVFGKCFIVVHHPYLNSKSNTSKAWDGLFSNLNTSDYLVYTEILESLAVQIMEELLKNNKDEIDYINTYKLILISSASEITYMADFPNFSINNIQTVNFENKDITNDGTKEVVDNVIDTDLPYYEEGYGNADSMTVETEEFDSTPFSNETLYTNVIGCKQPFALTINQNSDTDAANTVLNIEEYQPLVLSCGHAANAMFTDESEFKVDVNSMLDFVFTPSNNKFDYPQNSEFFSCGTFVGRAEVDEENKPIWYQWSTTTSELYSKEDNLYLEKTIYYRKPSEESFQNKLFLISLKNSEKSRLFLTINIDNILKEDDLKNYEYKTFCELVEGEELILHGSFKGTTSNNEPFTYSLNTDDDYTVTPEGKEFEEFIYVDYEDISNMFINDNTITYLDMSDFEVSHVTNMTNMFSGCSSLETLDLSGWEITTSNLDSMFKDCHSLTKIIACSCSQDTIDKIKSVKPLQANIVFAGETGNKRLSDKTESILNGNYKYIVRYYEVEMFDCNTGVKSYELSDKYEIQETIDVTKYYILVNNNSSEFAYYPTYFSPSGNGIISPTLPSKSDSVTVSTPSLEVREEYGYDAKINMDGLIKSCLYMFRNNANITEINLNNFYSSDCTNFGGMFTGCSSLKKIELVNLDIGKGESLNSMFNACTSIIDLDLSVLVNKDSGSLKSMTNMFYDCTFIKTINMNGFNTSNVTNISNLFTNCKSLNAIDLSGWKLKASTTVTNLFVHCDTLEHVYMKGCDSTTVNVIKQAIKSANLNNVTVHENDSMPIS